MNRLGTRATGADPPDGAGGAAGSASVQAISAGGTPSRSRTRAAACHASNVGAMATVFTLPSYPAARGASAGEATPPTGRGHTVGTVPPSMTYSVPVIED